MIKPEVKERVLTLHRRGRGIRWIARHLELSRATVRRIVRETSEGTSPTKPRPSILDPFKKDIAELLREHEAEQKALGGVKDLTTRSIFKLLRKKGYRGGMTIVDDYLRELRGRRRRARKPYCRFETPPAEESQQDWSPYRVVLGGVTKVVHVFSLVLSWSRCQYLEGFLGEGLHSLLYGHVGAFKYFGGVPWKVLYDRQAAITPGAIDGRPLLNEAFEAFAAHYGFEISLCAPGDKERKGKIEKIFLDFENDFLGTRGRRFESLEDFNSRLRRWLDGSEDPEEGNHHRHGTTGEVPYERWLEERQYLYELPVTDHLPRRVEKRVLYKDSTVSVGGRRYSVPARLVEDGVRELWASIGQNDLHLYDLKGTLVATHALSHGPEKLVLNEQHYEEIRRRQKQKTLPELERQFLERFQGAADFLRGLKEVTRSIAPIHLREILSLARRYGREEVEAALGTAVEHSSTTSGYVRRLLERERPTAPIGRLESELPRGLSLGEIDPGDASGYDAIFGNDDERSKDHDATI